MGVTFYKKTRGFMRKTFRDDPDVCEVRMPIDTYQEFRKSYEALNQEIRMVKEVAKTDLACAELDTEQARRDLKDVYEKKLKKQKQEAEERLEAEHELVNDANETIKMLQNDLDYMTRQNENLLRIARERGNAERGVTPKKEHHGYITISSSQAFDRVQVPDPKASWKTELVTENRMVWKSVLQTPYSVLLPIDSIASTIHDELMLKVLGEMGVDTWEECENGCYPEDSDTCIMYKWTFRTSRDGFWEVEIWTTGPVVILERNLPRKQGAKKLEGMTA